ncbi:hypothetical protein L202_02310 [Cryptococcus amylolentus CBS 6039]|uniref:Wings apart-like protein C-terminal domain-containing protein n=1 Tax=Cryptococcus amylolentus CBS 6039 TaxID=1295533 RepID=A0A1E3I062_9TREE|nr:hypothetical protein L202_02310 [Cryptococcus amylolentus CBS 6039]ODN81979.1 hypothetical protein L202_02310 [Cryptococcus amylolentus CBS 6039]
MPTSPSDVSQNKIARRTYGRRSLAHKQKRKSELLTGGESNASDDGTDHSRRRPEGMSDAGSSVYTPKRKRTASREQSGTGDAPTSSSRRHSPSPSRERRPEPETDIPAQASGLVRPTLVTKRAPKAQDGSADSKPGSSNDLPSPQLPISRPPPPLMRELQTKRPITRTLSGNRIEHPDLSAIFAGVSPGRRASHSPARSLDGHSDSEADSSGSRLALPKPSGLRRMLTRTQSLGEPCSASGIDDGDAAGFQASSTKPSVPAPLTPPGALRRLHSMPESPHIPSPKESQSEEVPIPQIQAVQPGSGGRAKRTYGKVRTMLVEQPKEVLRSQSTFANIDSEEAQESYTELRHKYEVDNTVLPNSRSASLLQEMMQARAPETVSDMRSRGENRRFIDELGYLLEGISDPTASSAFRRSSAVDILQNMQDVSWLTKMKICGQVDKAWDCFYGASFEDEIMRAACLLFLVVLMLSGSGLEQVLSGNSEQCVALVAQNLNLRDGPLDITYKTKVAGSVTRLRQLGNQLDLGWKSTLATRRLASVLLRSICSGPLWTTAKEAFESQNLSALISSNLQREIFPVINRLDLYEKGMELVTEGGSVEFQYLAECLGILLSLVEKSKAQRENYLQTYPSNTQNIIYVAIISCNVALTSPDPELEASTCVVRAIQLLAHLATAVPAWATTVIQSSGGPSLLARIIIHRKVILGTADEMRRRRCSSTATEMDEDARQGGTVSVQPEDPEMSEEEYLCFGLALLTTSAITDGNCASVIARTNVQGDCLGNHGCLLRCRCMSPMPLGRQLAYLYERYQRHQDDAFAPILAGNLALLFSKIFIASPETSGSIIGALPGASREEKLQGLARSLRELNELQLAMQNTIGKLFPRGFVLEDDVDKEAITEGEVATKAIRDIEAFMD